jgi:hypothetical protein
MFSMSIADEPSTVAALREHVAVLTALLHAALDGARTANTERGMLCELPSDDGQPSVRSRCDVPSSRRPGGDEGAG